MDYEFADAEALRLLRAFHKITDPEARCIVIAVAEAAARGAAVKVKEPEPALN